VRQFCEELARDNGCQDWQVQQAEQALRIDFNNFLRRTDWRQTASTLVDENGSLDYCVLYAPGLACAWRVPRPTIP